MNLNWKYVGREYHYFQFSITKLTDYVYLNLKIIYTYNYSWLSDIQIKI